MAIAFIIYLLSVLLTILIEVLYWKKHSRYSQEETLGQLVDFLWSGWSRDIAAMPIPMPPIVVLLPVINIVCILIGGFELISFSSGEWRNKKIK